MSMIRKFALFGIILNIGLLASGYYVQYFLFVDPCLLCILQRAVFYSLALVSLILFFVYANKKLKITCLLFNIFLSTIGWLLAARQLWLQQLPPDKIPACLPGFDKLLETYPIFDVISMAIKGSGDCSEISFTIFGFSIAVYSLLAFLFITTINSFFLIWQKKGGLNTHQFL